MVTPPLNARTVALVIQPDTTPITLLLLLLVKASGTKALASWPRPWPGSGGEPADAFPPAQVVAHTLEFGRFHARRNANRASKARSAAAADAAASTATRSVPDGLITDSSMP